MRAITVKHFYRIIDANLNRAAEGLRVCEDICRFVLDEKAATQKMKDIRHRLVGIVTGGLQVKRKTVVLCRDIHADVGTRSIHSEFSRKNIGDIFYANAQRVKESLRVLEEFLKLSNARRAQNIKELRYAMYALEQDVAKKIR